MCFCSNYNRRCPGHFAPNKRNSFVSIDLEALKKPFPEDEIEWRIGSAGKKGNGQIWATCLAYVQARAIMNRLDEVCGAENWRVSYRFISGSSGIEAGV